MPTPLGIQYRSQLVAPVSSIGLSAAPFLACEGPLGRVCASFRRSCHVQTLDGEVLCIAHAALGRGPLTVSVRLDVAGLQALGAVDGSPVVLEDQCLYVGPLVLVLANAAVWSPQHLGRAVDNLAGERARWLAATISQQVPADGLGCLLPFVEGITKGQWTDAKGMTPLASLALTSLSNLVDGLLIGDVWCTNTGVTGLLGLGPGLTPSGDDLLVGLLLALHSGKAPAADSVSRAVVRHAPVMTGRISVSMLKQASLGLGSEASHAVIMALVDGCSSCEVLQRAEVLTRVGHTSGWDTLVGILLGLHLAERLSP